MFKSIQESEKVFRLIPVWIMTLPVYFSKSDKLPQEKSRAGISRVLELQPISLQEACMASTVLGKKDLGTGLSVLYREKLYLHKAWGKSLWFSTGRDEQPAWSDFQVQGVRLLLEKKVRIVTSIDVHCIYVCLYFRQKVLHPNFDSLSFSLHFKKIILVCVLFHKHPFFP